MKWTILGVFVLTASLGAQQLDCVRVDGSGGAFSLSCQPKAIEPPPPPPPPVTSAPVIAEFRASATQITVGQTVTFAWTVTGTPAPTLRLNQSIGAVTGSSYAWTPTTTGARMVTLTATNSVGKAAASWTVTVNAAAPPPPPPPPPPVDPPPATGAIWGPVDPAILGDFTAAEHDVWTTDGGDDFRYRVWHHQCPVIQGGQLKCFAHEHGDNPDSVRDPWVRARWDGRFGYAARRHKDMPGEPDGHIEAHEGYKVFVANKGDTNDEGRVNRTWTLASFHMGTGGPARFRVQHHSGSLASRHDWPGQSQLRTAYHILANTGGVATVCDPRAAAPVKDVMQLNSPCKLNSQYEIWRAETPIIVGGQEIARVFQTPASFDPITIRNPADPNEVVYANDPRMAASKSFPGDNWSGNKDVQRETYAQNPYLYTDGPTATDSGEYCLNPLGVGVACNAADAIPAFFEPNVNTLGVASTQDNLQFKMRVDYGRACEPDRNGGCTRTRAGLTGTTNAAKIGLKN